MAVTNVSLSDAVSAWVTKTNTIASDLGDRATLETTASGNLVAAINEIHGKALDTDSASTRLLFTGNKGLSYNSTSGEFNIDSNNVISFIDSDYIQARQAPGTDSSATIALINANSLDSSRGLAHVKSSLGITGGKFADTTTINFDSSGPRMSIQSNSITSALFNSAVTLTIFDSAGSSLKVLRSPGS
tara:strand:- start:1545 stop:2108 length:564 start_codon:yes stop_codon:yes gene_type:complete